MTTKFNQDVYSKMKVKKNEPLSALRKRVVRVVDQGTLTALVTFVPETTRVPSSTTSVEELTSRTKKPRMEDKEKEKAYLQPSSVWGNASLALTKAQDLFTADELKVLSGVPSNKLEGRHVHRLVHVIFSCNLLFTPSPVFLGFDSWFFFSSFGRDRPYNLGVSKSGG